MKETYLIPNMTPGPYEITITAPGFSTLKQTVRLEVGAKFGLDAHLTVGNAVTTG